MGIVRQLPQRLTLVKRYTLYSTFMVPLCELTQGLCEYFLKVEQGLRMPCITMR